MVAAPQYRAAANTAMGWKNSNLRGEGDGLSESEVWGGCPATGILARFLSVLIPPIKHKFANRLRLPVFYLIHFNTVEHLKMSSFDASRQFFVRRDHDLWVEFHNASCNMVRVTKGDLHARPFKRICKSLELCLALLFHQTQNPSVL